jgi:methylglutaconyl-CoA hydratase
VRECKQLVVDLADKPIDETLISDTADRIARIRASDEGREGVRSFLEKSKPSWLA